MPTRTGLGLTIGHRVAADSATSAPISGDWMGTAKVPTVQFRSYYIESTELIQRSRHPILQ